MGVALLAVAAQIQIPIGPVPITLQSLVIFTMFLLYSPEEIVMVISAYLLLGAVGIPVGAAFNGGLGWLIGPTGGFLFGFLLAAIIVAIIRRYFIDTLSKLMSQTAFDVLIGIITIIVYYGCGVAWLMLSTGMPLSVAFSVAVLPFLIPDGIKLIIAVKCVQALREFASQLN